MEQALIGLGGILIGIVITEYFRRRNRIEYYSQKIFDKRLQIYEELFSLMQHGNDVVTQLIDDENLSKEERHDLISDEIMTIADFTDAYEIYLNKFISLQSCTFLMGAEDIQDIEDDSKKEEAIKNYQVGYKKTKDAIIQESGIEEVNKHFKTITKSNPDTPIIKYMKKLEK